MFSIYQNAAFSVNIHPNMPNNFYCAILFIPSTHRSISSIVFSAPKANLTVPWGKVWIDLWAVGAQ